MNKCSTARRKLRELTGRGVRIFQGEDPRDISRILYICLSICKYADMIFQPLLFINLHIFFTFLIFRLTFDILGNPA